LANAHEDASAPADNGVRSGLRGLSRGLGRITGAFGGRDGSRTAQRVAAIRAGFDRPSTPEGDDDAQRLLCRGMGAPARAPWLRPHLLARTRFFDEATLAAIARGVTQVVILGAGYDDRALRFRTPGVRFFELDHPGTQADKRRRLIAGGLLTDGLELIAADFKHEDVSALLERAGHTAGRDTLFICEGLLVYFDGPAIVTLLAALAARASPASTLAASLAIHPGDLDPRVVATAANARRRLGASEPWVTILPLQAHLGLLHDGGWVEYAVVDDTALEPRAVPGRSVLVTANPR
jgi:methyltransferase (TIGR00027 family)